MNTVPMQMLFIQQQRQRQREREAEEVSNTNTCEVVAEPCAKRPAHENDALLIGFVIILPLLLVILFRLTER